MNNFRQIDVKEAREVYNLSERDIDHLINMSCSPAFRRGPRGKWLFNQKRLEEVLLREQQRR